MSYVCKNSTQVPYHRKRLDHLFSSFTSDKLELFSLGISNSVERYYHMSGVLPNLKSMKIFYMKFPSVQPRDS